MRLLACAVIGLAGLVLRAPVPTAQEVTGPALKAAFIFNFIKFTTWPDDALPADAPLSICVVDDPSIGAALRQSVGGRVVLGHEIQVVDRGDGDALRSCHVVYVSGTRATAVKVIERLRGAPVLTVSDVHAFTAAGGMAQLHLQQGQLRFAIERAAARDARLQISARLMALARQP